ncbi:carbohydrate ABC transporter permease [Shinella sp. PSBB067]|uniref:carbohydrate ABC transporter permease n=1 Tax=Shinella sp. PSBB067 TaxID=2715959 RepID=UPI000A782BC4
MSAHLEGPAGRRPQRMGASRIAIYVFLFLSALFFIMPLYVMVVTSLKDMAEIRQGNIFALPAAPTIAPWIKAWSGACTGLTCEGVGAGFVNSVLITLPAVTCSVFLGAINGYALSFWRFPGANLVFAVLMAGAFIPLQVFIYPLVRIASAAGVFGTLPGVILLHICFSLPLMTLLFRNFYGSVPMDLYKAARVDGAGFWQLLIHVFAPMSVPITVVAFIIQITGTWNDFILGLIFAGADNMPITVLLNNVVNSQFGEREYNVNMAATILTGLVPLVLYFLSGRWFVRGIMAGAVKG